MSTRSHIGKKLEDGTIKYIYCHFDGYPEHNGKILKEHYTNEAKIDALLELGDISILGPEIGEEQDFDRRETHHKDWCLAYGRDRGEANVKASICNEIDFADQEYNYLWENGEWRCFAYNGELKF
jgi:hypothetical protein